MRILKNYEFAWWQFAILKLGLLFIGVAAGAYWHEFFSNYVTILVSIGIIFALYMKVAAFKQMRQ